MIYASLAFMLIAAGTLLYIILLAFRLIDQHSKVCSPLTFADWFYWQRRSKS